MVGFKHMGWLPEITHFRRDHTSRRSSSHAPKKKGARLGILAFEAAKTMSRLLSLYKSLSNDEISRLKNDIVKSRGVSYLNSEHEEFLLSLACSERLEDLDRAVAAVSRLGKKCNDSWLNRFDLVFVDLKLGIIDSGNWKYGSKYTERKVMKMEKLVSSTASLHAALEVLTEMENTERRMKQRQVQLPDSNPELFYQKLENQRKEVHHFKTTSLWRKSFDKSVTLMVIIVIVVYTRISIVFKPYISVLPAIPLLHMSCFEQQREFTLFEQIKEQIPPTSGYIFTELKPSKIRIYSRKSDVFFNDCDSFNTEAEMFKTNNRVFHAAGPATVGGSGLALHYANVIILLEKYLDSSSRIDHHERESLYQMLPENLKAMVGEKLSKGLKYDEQGEGLAEGWREAMAEMMGWLGLVANDTLRWHVERNVDRMTFDSKPSVLLLQTLHFSDKEKTEAAIAELLVGLSCIYRFENRRLYV